VTPGSTAVVVGDGAVGLLGVLSAKILGAERIIAMSRYESRQNLARNFGATDIVAARGAEGEAEVMDLTGGIGADAVLECVGTGPSMETAFNVIRPGGTVGFVGVPHGVTLPVRTMFEKNARLAGGMAPVRRYLPDLLPLVLEGEVKPGLVFDSVLPLADAAEGYRQMDEREAIKVFLQP
jgi:threonine dehydrogenase-like Zn-dependent dehydrogenase